jgi:trans-L-3-hydroxyproline dehydratase
MAPQARQSSRWKPPAVSSSCAQCLDGTAERIFLQNLQNFAGPQGATVEVECVGTLTVDVAFGGDSFVMVDAKMGFALIAH